MRKRLSYPVRLERKVFVIGKKAANTLFLSLVRPLNSQMVTVKKISAAEGNAYYRNAMICPSGMLLETENFLNGNLLRDQLVKHPRVVLQKIIDFYRVSGWGKYWVIAADVCRYLARTKNVRRAAPFYLSAYYYCYIFLKKCRESEDELTFSTRDLCLPSMVHIANEAIAGIFRVLKLRRDTGEQIAYIIGVNGEKFELEDPFFDLSVPVESIVDFSLCSDYDVKGLSLINRHPGDGVPLVGKIAAQKLSKSLKTPPGLTIPVTMILRAQEHPNGAISLRPVFLDTSKREMVCAEEGRLLVGKRFLERDFTTPFACFLNAVGQRNLLAAMLKPGKHTNTSGLFMVEPYQPEKIPVVFVHGLLSSPETWGEMVNSLKNNPIIRQRYQFWFYSYPTGFPVIVSANDLRQALLEAREEFCTTKETTENFEKMVLIGHSMGGMITRLLLQQDPTYIFEQMAKCSIEVIREKLSDSELKKVESFLRQDPLDFIHRAIFMAVPHRGAVMAQRSLAKLGINLTRQPERLRRMGADFLKISKKLFPDTEMIPSLRVFSGIGNLNPDHPLVRALGNSPLKADVTFHSIIGNKNAGNIPGGSDGIVSYSSSHIDEAASECIVKSHHSVHQTPAAILEVLRILLLHLQS